MTYYIATVWHPLRWLEKHIEKYNESPDRMVLTFFKEIPEYIYNELIENPKFKDFVR